MILYDIFGLCLCFMKNCSFVTTILKQSRLISEMICHPMRSFEDKLLILVSSNIFVN